MTTKTLDIQKIIDEDFARRAEAALFLEVAEHTLVRWVRQKIGPPVTWIGNRMFFDRHQLAVFKRSRAKAKAVVRP